MNSPPVVTKSFEERMFDQIKSQMGDLLTAEELKDILDKSITKAFFEDRTATSGYNNKTVKEPLFVELIRKELSPLIEAGVKQWLSENQGTVGDILKETIGKNAADFVARAFSSMMQDPMQQFAYDLRTRLGANGINL